MEKPRVVIENDGIYLEEPICGSIVKRTPIMTENECPWDLMYDKPGVDYADDCMDFRSRKE